MSQRSRRWAHEMPTLIGCRRNRRSGSLRCEESFWRPLLSSDQVALESHSESRRLAAYQIEGPYDKCMDWCLLSDPADYYMAARRWKQERWRDCGAKEGKPGVPVRKQAHVYVYMCIVIYIYIHTEITGGESERERERESERGSEGGRTPDSDLSIPDDIILRVFFVT